jgi:hypothetical protein
MSYPYGATVPPVLPDLPYTVLQRRQGDVKATLIPLTLNGASVNISGWTFVFSVTLPSGLQTVVWTILAPASGTAITTINSGGFSIPGFNSTASVTFASTSQLTAANQILISGAGVYTVESVTNSTVAIILNSGLPGNLPNGTINAGTTVYQLGQVGMTVLVIPSSITTAPIGMYPMYLKYETNDPSPGPYVNTFMQGVLQILAQNDPNA